MPSDKVARIALLVAHAHVLGLLFAIGCGSGSQPSSAATKASDRGDSGGFTSATDMGGVSGRGDANTSGASGGAETANGGAAAASGSASIGDAGGDPNATSGAAGSAAAGAAGATGGNAGTGAAGSCPGLFCEDFESGKVDDAIWNSQANGGQTVKVQTAIVAHGKYAVQFHGAPNVVSYDFIITKHAPTALAGHHYGRVYFYVTPKPPQEHTELIFAGSSGFPKLKYLEIAESGLGWQLTYVQLVAPTGETYKPATGAIPLAKWACLQWEMSDTPDQISVSVDGAKPVSFDSIAFMGKNTGLVGGFSDFGFGFYIWHPATYPFDAYYDDFVLDTKPIACITP